MHPAEIIPPLLEKTVRDSCAFDPGDVDAPTGPVVLAFLNAHGVNTAVRDGAMADLLLSADYLLRDGVGIELALRYFGLPPTPNLNGTDLTPRLLARDRHRSIAIFGTSEMALAACAERLRAEGHDRIVALEHGFQDDEAYLAAYRRERPALTLLCMGMPRQERLAMRLREDGHPGVIACVGGWADFHGGTKPRAPRLVQRARAEWLYRLANEPRRLGKRYTVDLGVFFANLRAARRDRD
jgi:exopolysaccharide biosynthesis WecB/TagA/CpsF family protein